MEMIKTKKMAGRGLLLAGAPGTGKVIFVALSFLCHLDDAVSVSCLDSLLWRGFLLVRVWK